MATVISSTRDEFALEHEARVEAHAARIQAEFHSRHDAVDMSEGDVANVEPLKVSDYESLLRRLKVSSPKLYRELAEAGDELWGGWADDDEKWTLTPHELRRARERQRQAL